MCSTATFAVSVFRPNSRLHPAPLPYRVHRREAPLALDRTPLRAARGFQFGETRPWIQSIRCGTAVRVV